MDNVITLPPKRVSGKKNNVTYEMLYDRTLQQWSWKVTVAVEPQVFTGVAATELLAKTAVDKIINAATAKRSATA